MSGIKIDIWDCHIRSLAFWPNPMLGVPSYLPDALLKNDAVLEAAEQAVEAQGGALNLSGWYDADSNLIALVEHLQGGAKS